MNRDDVIEAHSEALFNWTMQACQSPVRWTDGDLPSETKPSIRAASVAALSALEAIGIALVPVEPTEAMIKAACETIDEAMGGFYPTDVQAITSGYGSMLSASPLRKTEGGEG